MKKIIINKTIILILSINDIINLEKGQLKKLKDDYLNNYDNCIIYNYFDLINNKQLIKDKINKLKFINQTKINARKCDIRQISANEKNTFLNNYHIQGTDKSQIRYGAYYYNELISVITFNNINKLTNNLKNNEYELSRFSVKTGVIVVGIFNKILKQFINDYQPHKIISYADLNLVNKTNNIYLTNGFKNVKNSLPDFQYYHKKNNKLYHKFTFGNKYIKNDKISTVDKNDNINQLIKFWNCGKIRYELFLTDDLNIIEGFIYQIKNKINNKLYIGQTVRPLHKRIYEYKSAYNLNKFHNTYLGNAFNKYGWDNFEITIIDHASNLSELNEKEIYYISKYQTTDKSKGYNLECGGNNAIPDISTLEKMSKSHKGIKQTNNWINKRIAISGSDEAKKYGRNKTDDEKKYLSENSPKYWLGKKRNDETRKKISKTKKENGLSDNQKKVLCKLVYVKNIYTNEITKYESTKHASIVIGVNQSTISRWCLNNKTINHETWSYDIS